MKKKFIKFLKDNDALIPFICNLALDKTEPPFFKYLNKTYPEEFMGAGFIWHETSEDFTYWSQLNDLWQNNL